MTAKPEGAKIDFHPVSFQTSRHPGLMATSRIAKRKGRAYITRRALRGEAIRIENITARPEGEEAVFHPLSLPASWLPVPNELNKPRYVSTLVSIFLHFVAKKMYCNDLL